MCSLGHDVPLDFNPDRNRRRIAEEKALRRFELWAKAAYPGLTWTKRKGKNPTLLAQWTPVLRVACPSEAQSGSMARLRICTEGTAAVGVDLANILADFRSDAAAEAAGTWQEV